MDVEQSSSVESFIPFLVPAVFAAVLGLIIWGAVTAARRTRTNLQALADRLGLRLNAPGGTGIFALGRASLEGQSRGRPMRIYTYTTGSGKSRTTWCAISLTTRIPAGFSLKVSGENLFTKAGRVFGIDDVETGDPSFDEKFYVKSKQASYIRAALIPEVRMRLLDALAKHRSFGTFTAEGGEVKYAEMGTFANAKILGRFPDMLEIAGDLAEIAEAYRD
ncbi:MAG: hypothetical protein IAE82_15475 [Opitutaceae bacterium]|nr:hypothetical protein [Opitutaceae bacterium]